MEEKQITEQECRELCAHLENWDIKAQYFLGKSTLTVVVSNMRVIDLIHAGSIAARVLIGARDWFGMEAQSMNITQDIHQYTFVKKRT